jgi:hypothetical protein
VTKSARKTKPKSSKRQTKQTKLDRLLAQGTSIEVDVDGRRAVYFKMPTPELQDELNAALEKKVRKDLKASGFELLHSPRRDHPFHSEILRERIDKLASLLGENYDPALETEKEQKKFAQALRKVEARFSNPSPKETIAAYVAGAVQKNRRVWAKAFEKYRNMLRDVNWWKGTYVYRAIYPEGEPPLPDGPPPKPVYMSKRNPDLVIQLRNFFVDLYVKVGVVVPA